MNRRVSATIHRWGRYVYFLVRSLSSAWRVRDLSKCLDGIVEPRDAWMVFILLDGCLVARASMPPSVYI